MPEPRFCHAAICVRGMLLVAGGLSSFSSQIDDYQSPPCAERVFTMSIVAEFEDPVWREDIVPAMTEGQSSLHASLLVIGNRYVY